MKRQKSYSSNFTYSSFQSNELDEFNNFNFTIEKSISDDKCSWIIKSLQTRTLNKKEREMIKKSIGSDIESIHDTILISPTLELINIYPMALIFDETSSVEKCTNKYEIFGTNVYYSICHGKYYLFFEREKLLFSMNLNKKDEVDIITKLHIKYVFTADGKINRGIDRIISGIIN